MFHNPSKYDEKVLRFIIKNLSDVNIGFIRDARQKTNAISTVLGLNSKAANLKIKLIKDLIRNGAYVNKPDFNVNLDKEISSESPLMVAYDSRNYADAKDIILVTNFLLKNGARINYNSDQETLSPTTPLEKILYIQDINLRHTLLNNLFKNPKWNPELLKIKNKLDRSVLSFISTNNVKNAGETIDFLISKGAYINYRSKTGQSLLHATILENSFENFKKYLALDLNTNTRDLNGHTPLHFLLDKIHYKNTEELLESLKLLFKYGANINAKDKNGNKPIHYAASYPKPKIIFDLLYENGAVVTSKNKSGLTPVMASSIGFCLYPVESHKKCTERLIKNVSYLLNKGASINDVNNTGMNLLHLASKASITPELVLFLINKGVNHKAKDQSGKFPIDYVKENKFLKDTKAYWKLHDLSFD